MPPRILPLSEDAISQIRSSKQITSLSGVVLALLENALDAGATKIEISVDFSRGNCTLEDNGSGIPPAEFREDGGLGKMHHTSKVSAEDPLHGTAGSYLVSLASLSLVGINSRHCTEDVSANLSMHQGRVISRQIPSSPANEMVTFPSGTRVVVRDLFGNMPVRVKQRALASASGADERPWFELKRDVAALLLAWRAPCSVKLRDIENQGRKIILSGTHSSVSSSLTEKNLNVFHYGTRKYDLRDSFPILFQAGLAPFESRKHWVPISASTSKISCQYERSIIPAGSWANGWINCFRGSLFKSNSNVRKTILGTSLQMMQQWTGVNFIFYYSTPFLQSTGAIRNTFLISLIFNLVNVCSTPLSFFMVEKIGRRPLLVWGALGMLICQFLVAIIGVTVGFDFTHNVPNPDPTGDPLPRANNLSAVNAQIAFIAIFIFFFATTWGPGAWIVIGEIFPLPIRSRGVALSTSSNWLWNTIIAVITPYMVAEDKGNLKSRVFFIWGALCTCAFVYAFFLIPETKGLSLEQVDKMMEETTPRTSAKWKPTTTFAAEMGLKDGGKLDTEVTDDVERKGSVF